jgi:hypothetical protein
VGNGWSVLTFTPSRFRQLARSGKPVVSDSLRARLIGSTRHTTAEATVTRSAERLNHAKAFLRKAEESRPQHRGRGPPYFAPHF